MIRFPSSVVNIIFFSSTDIEWNNLELKIRNFVTFSAFEKSILKFIRPSTNSNFNCHSPKGIKLITGLSLDLSKLREHKFRHNFQDTLNLDTDLWGWHQNCNSLPTSLSKSFRWKEALLDNLESIAKTFTNLWIFHLAFLQIMMHQITRILNATIQYILATKRFGVPLTKSWAIRNIPIFQYVC